MKPEETLKIYVPDVQYPGYQKYPWACIPLLPLRSCFFDSWHGVVGYAMIPFALTTRAMLSDTQFLLLVYEDDLKWD